MAEVKSTFELKRGSEAPAFELPEPGTKGVWSLDKLFDGKDVLVVMFVCNHCPFVQYLADEIGVMAGDYTDQKVQFVAINSNDSGKYPDDAPDKMPEFAKKHGWTFPYLHDADQSVAKAYSAACTPDFYVFNNERTMTYAGQFDGARPGNGAPVTGADVRSGIESTLRSGTCKDSMRPSTGCNIKWIPGNEPDYFG